jgi:hypothetical protein
MNLLEILSNLAQIGEATGFSVDVSIQNERLVVVISDIPEE